MDEPNIDYQKCQIQVALMKKDIEELWSNFWKAGYRYWKDWCGFRRYHPHVGRPRWEAKCPWSWYLRNLSANGTSWIWQRTAPFMKTLKTFMGALPRVKQRQSQQTSLATENRINRFTKKPYLDQLRGTGLNQKILCWKSHCAWKTSHHVGRSGVHHRWNISGGGCCYWIHCQQTAFTIGAMTP